MLNSASSSRAGLLGPVFGRLWPEKCPGRRPGQFGTGFWSVRIGFPAEAGPKPAREARPGERKTEALLSNLKWTPSEQLFNVRPSGRRSRSMVGASHHASSAYGREDHSLKNVGKNTKMLPNIHQKWWAALPSTISDACPPHVLSGTDQTITKSRWLQRKHPLHIDKSCEGDRKLLPDPG